MDPWTVVATVLILFNTVRLALFSVRHSMSLGVLWCIGSTERVRWSLFGVFLLDKVALSMERLVVIWRIKFHNLRRSRRSWEERRLSWTSHSIRFLRIRFWSVFSIEVKLLLLVIFNQHLRPLLHELDVSSISRLRGVHGVWHFLLSRLRFNLHYPRALCSRCTFDTTFFREGLNVFVKLRLRLHFALMSRTGFLSYTFG